jgi:hypothetical protein
VTHPNTGLPLPIGVDFRANPAFGSYRYSSFFVPPIGSPGQLTGLGSALWWQTLRDDLENVGYPVLDGETHPTRVYRTAYGVKPSYVLGVRLRRHPSRFLFKTATAYASFLALFRSCQEGTNAFLWWRDTSISDAMLVGFSESDLQRELNPRASVSVLLEELAMGVAIPTA